MKNIFALLILLITLFTSCTSDDGYILLNRNTFKYPTTLNNEWKYKTTQVIIKYDSTGKLKDTLFSDEFINVVQVRSTNVIINKINNIIEFTDYLDTNKNQMKYDYYLNTDSGFYAIAYNNSNYTYPINPVAKSKYYLNELTKLKRISQPYFDFNQISNNDSINFYNPYRQVLSYPLNVGKSWTELSNPFQAIRTVKSYSQFQTALGKINVFLIERPTPSFGALLKDYISTKYGVVKREIIGDSIMLMGENDPTPIGFAKSIDVSELIQTNIK